MILLRLWLSGPVLLIELFFALGSAYLFFNAKKLVPPSRDPHWWRGTRIVTPFFFFPGVAAFVWTLNGVFNGF